MKVIPETRRAHYIWYLRFITDIVFASFDDSLYDYRLMKVILVVGLDRPFGFIAL